MFLSQRQISICFCMLLIRVHDLDHDPCRFIVIFIVYFQYNYYIWVVIEKFGAHSMLLMKRKTVTWAGWILIQWPKIWKFSKFNFSPLFKYEIKFQIEKFLISFFSSFFVLIKLSFFLLLHNSLIINGYLILNSYFKTYRTVYIGR